MVSKLLVRVEKLCPGLKSFSTKRKNSSTGVRWCSDQRQGEKVKTRGEKHDLRQGELVITPVVRYQFEEMEYKDHKG
jgi:hypothetical protein